MVKRILPLLLVLCLLPWAVPVASAESAEPAFVEPTLSKDASPYDAEHPENLEADQLIAHSAILIEESTGSVIFEKNADAIMYPASTTKILTVLLALMMGDPADLCVASDVACNIPADSSNMDLMVGEEMSLLDLCYGTILRSANEGANVLAEHISGSIPAFVELMNRAAETFGCRSTHFANPHGYHDPYHYTTARDLAIIAREAMKNELFREIVKAYTYQFPRTNMQRSRGISVNNRYMTPGTEEKANKYFYPYGTGIKTGFHSQAGYCYVGAAEKDGVSLISVVLYTSDRGRWTDTKKLMEYGFSQYESVTPIDLYNMNPIKIETTNFSLQDPAMGQLALTCVSANGQNAHITATKDDIKSMGDNLRNIMYFEYTRDFTAPIVAGEIMGTMTYFPDLGEPVEYNLIASRSVAKRENAPPTLEEIVAMTEADPNPLPPLSVELVLVFGLPILLLWFLFWGVWMLAAKVRARRAKIPTPKSRYLK